MRLQKAFYRVGLGAILAAGSALAGAAETAYPAADFKPSVIIAAPEAAKPAAAPLLLAAATPAVEAPEAKPQAAAKPTAKPAKAKLAARSAAAAEKKESGPGAGDFLFLVLAMGALLLAVTGNNIKSLIGCVSGLLSKLGKPGPVSTPAPAQTGEAPAEEECTEKAYGYSEEVKIYGYAEVVEPLPAPVIYGYVGDAVEADAVPAPAVEPSAPAEAPAAEAAAPVAEAAPVEEPAAEAAAPAAEVSAPVEAAAPVEASAPAEEAAPVEVAAAVEAAAPAEVSAPVEAATAPVEPATKPKKTTTRRAAPRKRK